MNIETYAPVFPGFYGTIFECDDTSQHTRDYLDHIGISYPEGVAKYIDLEPDYLQYYQEMAERVVKTLNNMLPDFMTMKFQELRSPREYNFSNDSIDVVVEVEDEQQLRDWIAKEVCSHDKFDEFIIKRYTSFDGFMSFYSNDPNDWRNVEDLSGHYLGTYLAFWFEYVEGFSDLDLYEETELPVLEFKIEPTCEVIDRCNEILKFIDLGNMQANALNKWDQWEPNKEKIFKEAAEELLK